MKDKQTHSLYPLLRMRAQGNEKNLRHEQGGANQNTHKSHLSSTCGLPFVVHFSQMKLVIVRTKFVAVLHVLSFSQTPALDHEPATCNCTQWKHL